MLREACSQRRWKNHARRDDGDGDDWDMASLHFNISALFTQTGRGAGGFGSRLLMFGYVPLGAARACRAATGFSAFKALTLTCVFVLGRWALFFLFSSGTFTRDLSHLIAGFGAESGSD